MNQFIFNKINLKKVMGLYFLGSDKYISTIILYRKLWNRSSIIEPQNIEFILL